TSQVFWAPKYSGDTSRRSSPLPVTCQDEQDAMRSCNISRLQMNLDSSAYSTSMGLSHSVLPTQSSMPTALAPSKLFHEIHPVQLALNATSATAVGHIVPPTVIDPTPNQHLKDTYVFIESPHPNINSELANCRGWIAMENLYMYVPLDHRTPMESAHTSHIMSA
ncbi:hypothetical protein B0H13DRAFT_2033306, partial [Mycena leptocephala]